MQIEEAIEFYGYYANWYADDFEFLIDRFGDDADLVAGLLAATSPRVAVKRSWGLAMKVYQRHLAGKPIDAEGYLPCHIPNIKRVLAGKELSGPKVSRFYRNLTGRKNDVTLDTWMLQWLSDGKLKSIPEKCYKSIERWLKKKLNSMAISLRNCKPFCGLHIGSQRAENQYLIKL